MFGDNLKKFRTDKGLSQNDLAQKLYVTRQCVSKWEKGLTQPDVQTLIEISELLDVSVDELVKNDGDFNKKRANKNIGLLIANILTAVFCILSFTIVFRFLPHIIPAHWTHGIIDRYGSRNEIFLNLITTSVFLVIDVVIHFAVRRVEDRRVAYVVHSAFMLCQVANAVFIIALYGKYLNDINSFATCLCSDMLLCLSVAMHPKINGRNYLFGFRTAETLKFTTVWNKTNALACYLFAGCSAVILVLNMSIVFDFAYLWLLAYVVLSVVIIIYSKLIGRAVVKNDVQS